jgi:hypothetical protein
VPELLEVPADPLVEGNVLDDVPDEPMPDVLPEVDPVEPVELLDDGVLLLDDGVELLEPPPAAPMPDVDEPVLPLDEDEGRDVDDDEDGLDEDDDDGLVDPLAEPPAEPMPDVEPVAEPVELQAASAAEQASARINLFIRNLLFGCEPPWREPRQRTPSLPCVAHGKASQHPSICVGGGRTALSEKLGSASASAQSGARRVARPRAHLLHQAVGPEQQDQLGLPWANRPIAVDPDLVAVVEGQPVGLAEFGRHLRLRAAP